MKPQKTPTHLWLYGIHACRLALENPRRQIISILATNDGILDKVLSDTTRDTTHAKVKIVDRQRLETVLPAGSVHQGIAINVARSSSPGN